MPELPDRIAGPYPSHAQQGDRNALRLAFTVLALAVYAAAYALLSSAKHEPIGVLAVIPAAMAGWLWGFRGGLWMGLALIPISLGMTELAGFSAWSALSHGNSLLLHTLFPIIGAGFGKLNELSQEIQEQLNARQQTSQQLIQSQQFCRSVLDSLTAEIAVLDESGKVIAVNAAWQRGSHSSCGASLSTEGVDYLAMCDAAQGEGADDAQEVARGIRSVLERKCEVFSLEHACHAPDERRWYMVRITRFPGDGPPRIVISHENITARKWAEEQIRRYTEQLAEANERLEQAAITDHLTELPNRRHGIQGLQKEWNASRRTGRPLSCIVLDIDHFKLINDTFGHAIGDCVLRETALNVQGCLRPDDLLCRMGGEEFLVICPNTTSEQAAQLAEEMRSAVEARTVAAGKSPQRVTISLGVATAHASMRCQDDLCTAADEAMYAAKRAGRNCVQVDPRSFPPGCNVQVPLPAAEVPACS